MGVRGALGATAALERRLASLGRVEARGPPGPPGALVAASVILRTTRASRNRARWISSSALRAHYRREKASSTTTGVHPTPCGPCAPTAASRCWCSRRSASGAWESSRGSAHRLLGDGPCSGGELRSHLPGLDPAHLAVRLGYPAGPAGLTRKHQRRVSSLRSRCESAVRLPALRLRLRRRSGALQGLAARAPGPRVRDVSGAGGTARKRLRAESGADPGSAGRRRVRAAVLTHHSHPQAPRPGRSAAWTSRTVPARASSPTRTTRSSRRRESASSTEHAPRREGSTRETSPAEHPRRSRPRTSPAPSGRRTGPALRIWSRTLASAHTSRCATLTVPETPRGCWTAWTRASS